VKIGLKIDLWPAPIEKYITDVIKLILDWSHKLNEGIQKII
jgi:hypothetical protein